MKKRVRIVFAMILVLSVMLSTMPTVFAAGFADTEEHWAQASIDRWSEYEVVKGKGDGVFAPDECMLRGEAAQVFTNLLGLNKTADISDFNDVAESDWYYTAIAKCYAAGIMKGKSSNMMDPKGNITREEFFTMFGRALQLRDAYESGDAKQVLSDAGFKDTNQVSDWSAGQIEILVSRGFVNGVSESELAPQADINRASVMALLDKSISTYVGKTADAEEAKEITARSEGITLIANPNTTLVTGNADIVVVAAGAEIYQEETQTFEHNDVRVEGASMPVARVAGENITVTVALSSTTDDAAVTWTGVDSEIIFEVGTSAKNVSADAEGSKIIIKEGAKAETVTVTETAKNATVEVAKGATAASVKVAAESTSVSVAGEVANVSAEAAGSKIVIKEGAKAETVTVAETAKNAVIEVAQGATAANVTVAAESASVNVAGKVDNVKVEETAKNTTVATESTAKIETVENKAENTAVVGTGEVESVKTSEDVKIETKTSVENTNTEKEIKVETKSGEETKLEKKDETKPAGKTETVVNTDTKPSTGGGGGGGGSYTPTHSHTYGTEPDWHPVTVSGTKVYEYGYLCAGCKDSVSPVDVTYPLDSDWKIEYPIYIADGQTVTLDLNGKNLIAEGCDAIYNKGTLTLKSDGFSMPAFDTDDDGNLNFTASEMDGFVIVNNGGNTKKTCNGVMNWGTLKVEAVGVAVGDTEGNAVVNAEGTTTLTNSAVINTGLGNAIYANSGTVNLNNGTVAWGSTYGYAVFAYNGSTVNVNGGAYYSSVGMPFCLCGGTLNLPEAKTLVTDSGEDYTTKVEVDGASGEIYWLAGTLAAGTKKLSEVIDPSVEVIVAMELGNGEDLEVERWTSQLYRAFSWSVTDEEYYEEDTGYIPDYAAKYKAAHWEKNENWSKETASTIVIDGVDTDAISSYGWSESVLNSAK